MIIRPIKIEDAEPFFRMMCSLDGETPFMMYEPGERESKRSVAGLKNRVADAVSTGDLLLIAEDSDKNIVGFIWAERGNLNRVLHTAYIVVGIRKAYQNQGIGTKFFMELDEWAKKNGIVRLELTVECENAVAIHLYEKNGFVVEGRRIKSMKLGDDFVDEFYMAKILEETADEQR